MNLSCAHGQELLIDHLHGELEPAVARQLNEHLGTCSACAMAYCRLQAEFQQLDQLLAAAPRPEVRTRLRAQLQLDAAPPTLLQRLLRLARLPIPAYQAVLLAVALLLAGLLLFPRPAPPGPGPAPQATSEVHAPSRAATTLQVDLDASRIEAPDPHLL